MVNIQKSGDSAIKFTFTENDRYLYNGEITVPLNSLILVLDESDMVVIKKVDGDVFLTFLIGNTNFSSKADLESWFKENACGSTGGGSGSGVTSGEVQTMIDESISGKADSSRVDTIEEVTARALVDLDEKKADTSAVTTSINAAVSGKQDTLVAGSGITISGNVISAEGGGKAIEAGRGIAITTGATADTVSFDLPISAGTGDNSFYGNGSNTVQQKESFAFGTGNTITTFVSSVVGTHIIGNGNSSQGGNNQIIGLNNSCSLASNANVIIGESNSTAQSKSRNYLFGNGNTTNAGYGMCVGFNAVVNNSYEIASGRFNNSVSGSSTFGDSGNTLFSVGNGTGNNTRHNAFEIRQNGDIYITSGGTDIKLQDQLGGGLPESAFTTYTAATEVRLAEDEEVTAAALNSLNDATAANTTALGGLKLVQLTQAQYDALAIKDASTLYFITGSN